MHNIHLHILHSYFSAQEWRNYRKGCYVRVQNLAWNQHRHGWQETMLCSRLVTQGGLVHQSAIPMRQGLDSCGLVEQLWKFWDGNRDSRCSSFKPLFTSFHWSRYVSGFGPPVLVRVGPERVWDKTGRCGLCVTRSLGLLGKCWRFSPGMSWRHLETLKTWEESEMHQTWHSGR
jgi:hypothetical protein